MSSVHGIWFICQIFLLLLFGGGETIPCGKMEEEQDEVLGTGGGVIKMIKILRILHFMYSHHGRQRWEYLQ